MHHLKYVQIQNISGPCKGFVRYRGYPVVLQHPANKVAKVIREFLLIACFTSDSSAKADCIFIVISLEHFRINSPKQKHRVSVSTAVL